MGRLRGKRNRDQDRYWTIQRRAEQSGMIAAAALLCSRCGGFAMSDDAIYESVETFCRPCARMLGFAEPTSWTQVVQKPEVGGLRHIDAMSATDHDGSGGHGGHKRVSASGVTILRLPQSATSSGYLRSMRSFPPVHVRARAQLWLSRLAEFRDAPLATIRHAADVVAGLHEAGHAVRTLRWRVYRQQFPRRQSEMPRTFTDAQVEAIRQRYATGTESFQRLGREFAVTGTTMYQVVTGDTYKRAGGPLHVPVGADRWLRLRRALERARPVDGVAAPGLGAVGEAGL